MEGSGSSRRITLIDHCGDETLEVDLRAPVLVLEDLFEVATVDEHCGHARTGLPPPETKRGRSMRPALLILPTVPAGTMGSM